MFVAGLSEGSSSTSTTTTRGRSSSVLSTSSNRASSRRPSHGANSLDPLTSPGSANLSLTSPLASPVPSSSQLPQSPPGEEVLETSVPVEMDERDREFEELLENLRGALSPKGDKGKTWIPDVERKEFRILLVDKSVRLPLRKIAPPAGSAPGDNVPHSPLSPLTPSSPVYPDGLIAPVWVRKHAELVPSVFVMFLRLYESPIPPEDEETAAKVEREKRDKEREKEMDDALVREIGDRRRRLGERGIKLTVVLMASTATLDSPSLDPRLSYLRRASQLSARSSLFVLTPVPAEELPDFVQSLQEALFDSAMEYYGAHAKRVRRKRARLPTGQFGAGSQYAQTDKGRPLGTQGWGVRYDWKAGWFAEVRGEYDVARRHYEDCWNELARMFASTTMLPPRTKRWAEAKVLADCVAIRICRLLLYEGEGARVTAPFFVHVKRFSDLSRGWGIGEETFEFWSWLARQYRIFAELLEMALAAGIDLPMSPAPTFPTSGPSSGPPTPEHWSTPVSSMNPIHALQQPAFYFYTAATCSVQRQRRFQEALDAEEESAGTEAGGYLSTAPGFANEKKVDHSGLIVELFTKAYTLLKERDYSRDHAALYVAFKIAETYCQFNQHELAMKFFERISPTFRSRKWFPIVKEIRRLWYQCAQITGDVETAARLLLEMMGSDSEVEGEERAALQDDLLSLLKTTTPASTDPISIDMDHCSLFDAQAGFWDATTTLPASAPMQFRLKPSRDVDVSSLTFSELHLAFSDDRPDVIIKHDEAVTDRTLDVGQMGEKQIGAPLRWGANDELVVTALLGSDFQREVQVSQVKLVLKEGSWQIDLLFSPAPLKGWFTSNRSIVPSSGLPTSTRFVPQPHAIKLEVTHLPSAFTDEKLPVTVRVTSEDDRTLTSRLSAFLHPSDEHDGSIVLVGEKESNSLIGDIELGEVSPGQSIERTIHLKSPVPVTKVLDISLHTSYGSGQTEEKAHTVEIPVRETFEATSTVKYASSATDEGSATVRTVLHVRGARAIVLDSLALESDPEAQQTLISHSLTDGRTPKSWTRDISFAIYSKFRLTASRRPSMTSTPAPPAHLKARWHTDACPDIVETRIPLPPLSLPIRGSFISASMVSPTAVKLHEPFKVQLQLTNSHPMQPASLSLELGTAEAFVWRGDRVGKVEVPPGEKRTIEMDVVAVGTTGHAVLPPILLWEERGLGEGRREIKVEPHQPGARVYVRP